MRDIQAAVLSSTVRIAARGFAIRSVAAVRATQNRGSASGTVDALRGYQMPVGNLIAFSVSDTGSGARERLRQILRYQLAYETMERIREGLIGLLAVCSGLFWVLLHPERF